MADRFDWNVVLRIAMDGGPQTKRELEALQRAEQQLEKQSNNLADAQKRLSQAIDNQAFEKQVSSLGKAETAQARLTKATEERARAEKALKGAGSDNERLRATNDLTKAVDNQTRAQSALDAINRKSTESTNSLRYANYDLATTLLSVSAGLTAVGAASVTAFASQESAFTSVERTADGALGGIRDTLTELSTIIPYTFNELAAIATLGNQLGIPATQLEAFTKTVAEFSTVTGISAEESALAFGKLGNLLGVLPEDYDRLASSIALVGRTTAATEKQIISVAGEIAPAAAAAGFTADQVVGLSGALASLKVPPERSRSTILQFFETLNNAVARGGDDLQRFATVVGVTASDLEQMVRSGQGQDILSRFIGNVSGSDTIEVTQALQALGLAGLRTNPTIRALAGNMKLLNDSLADGATGYQENTELQRQMAMVLDDLSTKWQNFVNASVNAAAAIGSAVAPAIGQLLGSLTDLLVGFGEFASSDIGQLFTRMATGILVAVAAWAALRGAIALATATTFAFNTATSLLGGKGIAAGLVGLAQAMGFYRTQANGATVASINFANGFKAIGRATVVIGILTLIGQAFLDLGGTVNFVGRTISNFGSFLRSLDWGGAFNEGADQIRDFGNSISTWSETLPQAEKYTADFGAAAMDTGDFVGDWSENQGDLNTNLDASAKKVRTLTDYASDLATVTDRAFQIRFDSRSTLDGIATSFQEMRDAAAEARQNIRQLQADLGLLNADLNTQQYFLGIAERYGDEKRAQALRAQIAKTQADIADKTADLNAEQQKNNRTLTGNTQAARDNRATITGLVSQYQNHVNALAASGLSTDELKRRTEQLKQDFIAQATQLGFNRQELGLYTLAFDDVRTAINNVPRDITVNFNADPALQALNEFVAQAEQVAAQAGTALGNTLGSGFGSAFDYQIQSALSTAANAVQAALDSLGIFANLGLPPALRRSPATASAPGSRNRRGGGTFAEGGYTGPGGKYEAAGIVHRGEYVIPKQYVNQATGLPHADALGRLQRGAPGRRGYSGGGFVSGGGMNGHIASFGPMAAMQLAQALSTQIQLDSGAIAGSVSRSFAQSAAVGAN